MTNLLKDLFLHMYENDNADDMGDIDTLHCVY